MNSFHDKYRKVSFEKSQRIAIQPILKRDLMGKAFAANKILNLYFKQMNSRIKLLPENNFDPEIKKMCRIGYFCYISELIHYNSKLLGFDYTLYKKNLSFAVRTKEKVYYPIIKYLNDLIDKGSLQ